MAASASSFTFDFPPIQTGRPRTASKRSHNDVCESFKPPKTLKVSSEPKKIIISPVEDNANVYNDLKTVLNSQINENTVTFVKPFFETILSSLNENTKINTTVKDNFTVVFSSLLRDITPNDENNTI